MRLPALQRYFGALITAPTGAEEGLAALRERDPGVPGFEAVFRETGELSAARRINIYADMYFFRLLEALRLEYPALRRWLGEERFHNLVTDFLLVHPSRSNDIDRAGDPLPELLAARPLAGFAGADDLAALERARNHAFVAADAGELLTLEQVRARPPEALGELAIRPVPSLRRVPLQTRADETWGELQAAGADPGEPRAEPIALRVWRRGFTVYHRTLESDEAALLSSVKAGTTFAELCESLDRGDAAPFAAAALSRWLGDGLLQR